MNYLELWSMALRSLNTHKLRSFLTILGIVIGLMTIVVVMGVIGGLNRFMGGKIARWAPDAYTVARLAMIKTRKERFEALKRPRITWNDYKRLRNAQLPNTNEIAAMARNSVDVRFGSKRITGINLLGVTGNFQQVFSMPIEVGAFFGEAEERVAAQVVVIGESTRAALFPGVNPIGRTILVRSLPFRVIGVLEQEGGGPKLGVNNDTSIYAPMSTYRQNFQASDEDLMLHFKAKGVTHLEASQDEVRAMIRAMRHTPFRTPDPFGILTQEALMSFWNTITGAAFLVTILISSISLTVSGVVIMNIMLVSVAERTREIGQRRAIGAKQRDIQLQFLLEAAMLSTAGGVIGILAGGLIIGLICLAGFQAVISPGTVAMGLFLSTFVGILAGYLPAWRASKLLIVDALGAE